jgi:ArsR family transcriptional regulator, arsenate/arsenite/antimonite-responsive transcriptional repressor
MIEKPYLWISPSQPWVRADPWALVRTAVFDYSTNMEMKEALSALTALGQTTRLAIFRLLVEAGPDGRLAGDIATSLSVPAATLSFHLKDLSNAGLITGESRSRYVCYRANFDTMNQLIEYLTRNCCAGSETSCCPPTMACATEVGAA